MTKPVFRFAPSPNGRLHLGHAYSALLNDALARRLDGRFLLRIEDIDITRCRPEYERAIYEDLAWLGLEWEKPIRRQSEHFADYGGAFRTLKGKRLAYPCFCSRKHIADKVEAVEAEGGKAWPRDPDGAPLYPGTCKGLSPEDVARRISAGEPHTWRIDSEAVREFLSGPYTFTRFSLGGDEEIVEVDPWRWGDAVIVRKDVPTSYHLSVVVDDALQGVTHVVRGQDLEAATDLHVLLQKLLGLSTPLYHHHGLILGPGGDKLAKSRRSEALFELRARGVTAAEIKQRLGFAP
ncbi:tRNA glutamyl-Q(34) synthetase GluQRS [Microvirga sp. KLBC 81]|uniref:tRNA glutamyl-Q(34) synthetase GluQRS n=1 Tax=Microvirga sp. KLBC 81 TaxID=1862707 RepID=UPI000D5191E1|nr:tRNA glutamyl-Q(34) synthetase GluQRS [Microvirga sp. KLBC 81]PVE22347.1 tRNA glutamyl-Q(34) synthetase GluQRS [Microvirga sp. KLBC 81]